MKCSFLLKLIPVMLLLLGGIGLQADAFNELEYNVTDNILYTLPESSITISNGTISFDGSVGTKVICDGKYDTVTGYDGTRWAVEEAQYGASIAFDFGRICDLDKLILETGYPCELEFKENCEIWNSFDVYYYNGADFVKIDSASVREHYENHVEINLKGISTKKLKIVSEQSTNFRVREIILTEEGRRKENIKCFYNGKEIDFSFYEPEIKNDRLMLPLNDLEEAMGFTYQWDDQNQCAVVICDDAKILFPIGSKSYTKNGVTLYGDTETYLNGSVPFVSARAFIEALDGYIFWDDKNNLATMISDKKMHNLATFDVGDSPFTNIKIDGKDGEIFCTPNCDFTQFTSDKDTVITLTYRDTIKDIKVLPRNENIVPSVNGNTAVFTVKPGQQLDVEINGNLERPLFVFVNTPIERPEETEDVIYFDSQKYYENPIVRVKDNQTIYIGDNVIVNGGFLMQKNENVRIIGNGIIYNSESRCSAIKMIGCKNITIDGPTVVNSNKWNNYWTNSDNITASNYKILGSLVWSDGIDVVGSRNVSMKKIFIRNQDDGICIKSHVGSRKDSYGDVYNVTAEDCVIWSNISGNSIEIGWEADGDIIRDLVFRDIDVIHRQTQDYKNERGALTIHNCGKANISNVLFEDVRIEHSDEQLFNIGNYVAEGFNTKSEGSIRNIYFRDIVLYGGYNAPSHIRKYSTRAGNPFVVLPDETEVDNIYFENINYKGKLIENINDAKECGFYIDDGINAYFSIGND